jgi:hypothetical protein
VDNEVTFDGVLVTSKEAMFRLLGIGEGPECVETRKRSPLWLPIKLQQFLFRPFPLVCDHRRGNTHVVHCNVYAQLRHLTGLRSMASDEENFYKFVINSKPEKAVKRAIEMHGLKGPKPNMSFPPYVLECVKGIAVYFNEKKGKEIFINSELLMPRKLKSAISSLNFLVCNL